MHLPDNYSTSLITEISALIWHSRDLTRLVSSLVYIVSMAVSCKGHLHVFFSCMITAMSGRPVIGSLNFAHTPYTLQTCLVCATLGFIEPINFWRDDSNTSAREAHHSAALPITGFLVIAYTQPRPTASYRRLRRRASLSVAHNNCAQRATK